MKPTLMIHEFREPMLQLPLGDYRLTFDDGLYSQYYYYNQISKSNTDMIFFISTDIVCTGAQSTEFPDCVTAHQKAFDGNREDYMSLEQIKFLHNQPNVRIGGHSHYHENIEHLSLYEKIQHIEADTEAMLIWFHKHLHYRPTDFCFPYNQDLHGIYKAVLTKHGFTHFYGSERTPIETLL